MPDCKHLVRGTTCRKGFFGGEPDIADCAGCSQNTSPPVVRITIKGAYAAAVSLLSTDASDEVVEYRTRKCKGCVHLWAGDEDHVDPIGWCKECGCGAGNLPALSRKVRKSGSRCPIGKWEIR